MPFFVRLDRSLFRLKSPSSKASESPILVSAAHVLEFQLAAIKAPSTQILSPDAEAGCRSVVRLPIFFGSFPSHGNHVWLWQEEASFQANICIPAS